MLFMSLALPYVRQAGCDRFSCKMARQVQYSPDNLTLPNYTSSIIRTIVLYTCHWPSMLNYPFNSHAWLISTNFPHICMGYTILWWSLFQFFQHAITICQLARLFQGNHVTRVTNVHNHWHKGKCAHYLSAINTVDSA